MAGKTLPMTDREKLNAIVWAASQAEMSYGKFVQTLNDAGKARIYREYRKYLNENETAILQRKHSSEDA